MTGFYQQDLFLPVGKEINSVVVLEEKGKENFCLLCVQGLKNTPIPVLSSPLIFR